MVKIALGTVQLGMHYGISNQLGKTEKSNAEKILKYASEQDINVLDTAPTYGNAENVIGDFIRNNHKDDYWSVITKTPHFKGSVIGDKQIKELLESFELSQNKLGKENIYGLLVHDCNNIFLPGGKKILNTMDRLKRDGVISKIGVSLYNDKQINQLLDNYEVDLVQLPINILDQRLVSGGQLTRLKNHGVEIHARSVFLQGLLLMSPNNIPSWFDPVRGVLESFHKEAKKRNMSVLQLALSFVQSIDEIDKVIVGVNTLKQLKEVVNAASIRVNTTELSCMSIDDPVFVNPGNWKT